jgi:hypothetical protein
VAYALRAAAVTAAELNTRLLRMPSPFESQAHISLLGHVLPVDFFFKRH